MDLFLSPLRYIVLVWFLVACAGLIPEQVSADESTTSATSETTTVEEDPASTTDTTTTETTTTEMPDTMELCKDEKHSSNLQYTCCNEQMFQAGIDLSVEEDFKKCFVPPKNGFQKTVPESLWSFYHCFIPENLLNPEGKVKLVSFAGKMAENFATDLKEKIKTAAVGAESLVSTGEPETEILRLVRSLYHQIEQKVCEGTYKKEALNVKESCSKVSDSYQESHHGRGGCCNNKQIPIPIDFFRLEPTRSIRDCTKNLMYSLAGNELYLDLDYEQSDAQQRCLTACTLQGLGVISASEITVKLKPDVHFNVSNFLPKISQIFSGDAKHRGKFLSYFDLNEDGNFTRTILEDIEEPVTAILHTEFYPKVNRTTIESVFFNCELYSNLIRRLELWLYDVCTPTK